MKNIGNFREVKKYYEAIKYVEDAEKFAKEHRIKRLMNLSKFVNDEDSLTLEVGCGSGVHKCDFKNWIGIDISESALKRAKPANVILASADHLPFKDSIFHLTLSFNLMEHLYNPEGFLEESLRVTKRGGIIVIYSPQLIKRRLFSIIVRDTIDEIKLKLGVRHHLRPLFKKPNYSKIGGDSDAVYLVDFQDIALFLKSRNCKIVNEKRRRFLIWLKKVSFIIAKKL